MIEIVRVDSLLGFRQLVAELGGDGEALLLECAIEPRALNNEDHYVSFRNFMLLFERAATVLDCPDFGMRLAARLDLSILGPLAVAIQSAETARSSLLCARRFMHFHNTALVLELEPTAVTDCELISIDFAMRRRPRGVQVLERVVASVHRLLGILCGSDYRPREVWLRHQPNAPIACYRTAFGATPRFGMPENGLIVPRALLDAPLVGSNPHVRRVAEHFLENACPDRTDKHAARARAMIARMLRSGGCTQGELARALGLQERTLQRRLKAEDTTFEALKDEARHDIAQSYLAQPKVPLSHIAELLGYAEASAFTRACRRWFGESPRDYRKRLA